MYRRAVFALATVIATACAPAAPAKLSDADKAAIQATVDGALKIANGASLDAAAYVKAYYAPDAIYMAPNEKSLTGTVAITEWFKALPPVSNVKFTLAEIDGTSDLAFLRGAYTFTVTLPGSAPITDSGKYLEIWRKQTDGSWRSERDVFNSDIPAAPPAPPEKKK
jgi:ketosteroid isomerase-like protein